MDIIKAKMFTQKPEEVGTTDGRTWYVTPHNAVCYKANGDIDAQVPHDGRVYDDLQNNGTYIGTAGATGERWGFVREDQQ